MTSSNEERDDASTGAEQSGREFGEQLALTRCDQIQRYPFSPPLPGEEVVAQLASGDGGA